jgi:hypothetical protein
VVYYCVVGFTVSYGEKGQNGRRWMEEEGSQAVGPEARASTSSRPRIHFGCILLSDFFFSFDRLLILILCHSLPTHPT